MQIIYPNDYSNQSRPDKTFEQEYLCAQQNGIHCLLLDSESAAMGNYKFSVVFEPDIPVIWRGWMLNVDEYHLLYRAVTNHGGRMLESVENYISNHYITGWYESCKMYTPETVITTSDEDFEVLTSQLQWPAYFVKDYVKSLTTSRGSVAKDAKEIREVIKLIEYYRGNLEGGVSLRRFESFVKGSERRYFVLNRKAFSADDQVPKLVSEIVQRVNTPFYTIDIAENTEGELRLVEIGDGQVSDVKEWAVDKLVAVFRV
ncbi:ATP-grasp domain-containing protein [Xenorhabdus innexi]|uniref:ATP-grasp domain-containing protein n=1 Tax=Xenorhabdus innexi TaxID=290109 RepID=A0A1N6MS59_9GAMM|nr:ATP-grasp domain-containing protein [Xenorhabdus innexi]PHM27972.1 hypothetical protein Xinn_03902 [Xenorhabdus innexi]SIP71579.1 conserved hypothetical protein [Xenorhabdus innexi]